MDPTTIPLEGVWRLRAADETKSVPCPIPGDNYSALQDAGRIPDPYWRDNEAKVQWVADRDWVFSRSFDVPAALLRRRSAPSCPAAAKIRILCRPKCHRGYCEADRVANPRHFSGDVCNEIGHSRSVLRIWLQTFRKPRVFLPALLPPGAQKS